MNTELSLSILNSCLSIARDKGLQPLSIVILDNRSTIKASISEEGVGTLRFDIALGKASAAIGMGFSTREFYQLVKNGVLPEMFANCINGASDGRFVPLPGGIPIASSNGTVLGAIGISGSSSDKDEYVALKAIEKHKLIARR
ncbi:MAG: heme-binding protein [Pseudomonadales bacterium]|nr:heme-binding protein [Pseudomonadales bacterium]